MEIDECSSEEPFHLRLSAFICGSFVRISVALRVSVPSVSLRSQPHESLEAKERISYERSSSTGWYAQGRVCDHRGREAERLADQRPPLCGLGDLPPERIAGGPEPDLCVADQRLVRADHS